LQEQLQVATEARNDLQKKYDEVAHKMEQDKMHQMQNFCDDLEQRVGAEVARTKETLTVLQEEVNDNTVHNISAILFH
jgi:hypothetical protein